MLERRPDLAKVLTEDFYRSRSGEVSAGELPYFKQPIFSFTDGYFSATGVGAAIDKAQKLPGVPPFTPCSDRRLSRFIGEGGPIECASTLASRRAISVPQQFRDAAYAARMPGLAGSISASVICFGYGCPIPAGRPIPQEQREGRSGRGVHLDGVTLIAHARRRRCGHSAKEKQKPAPCVGGTGSTRHAT